MRAFQRLTLIRRGLRFYQTKAIHAEQQWMRLKQKYPQSSAIGSPSALVSSGEKSRVFPALSAYRRFYSSESATAPLLEKSSEGMEKKSKSDIAIEEYQRALKGSDPQKLCVAYEKLMRNGVPLDFDSMQELIVRLSKYFEIGNQPAKNRALMMRIGRAIESLTRKMEEFILRNPDSNSRFHHSTLKAQIFAFGSLRYHRALDEAIMKMKNSGKPLNRDDYHVIITALTSVVRFEDAIHEFQKLLQGNKPSPETFDVYLSLCERICERVWNNDAITAEERNAHLEQVDIKWLNEHMEQFVDPRLRNFDRRMTQLMYINGAKGSMPKSMDILKTMVAERQRPPSPFAYKRLIQLGIINKNDELITKSYREFMQYHSESVKQLNGALVDVADAFMRSGNSDLALQAAQYQVQAVETGKTVERDSHKYYSRLAEIIRPLDGAQELVTVLDEAIKSMKEADAEIAASPKPERREPFDFPRASKEFDTVIESKNTTEALDLLRKFGESKRMPLRDSLLQLNDLLVAENSAQGIEELYTFFKVKAPFPIAMNYARTLMHEDMEPKKLWSFYRDVIDQKKYRFNPVTLGQMVRFFTEKKSFDWANHVLADAERAVAQSERPMMLASGLYNNLMQGYMRSGEQVKALNVYKSMIRPNNPAMVTPSVATYNSLLMMFLSDWDMKSFDELYSSLRKNLKSYAATESLADDSKLETIKEAAVERWTALQKALKEDEARSTFGGVPTVAAPCVHPNRATENIRLLALVTENRLDDAEKALRESFTEYEQKPLVQPNLHTYECLAACYLRKHDPDNWNDRIKQRALAEKCQTIMENITVTSKNVDEMLNTCEQVVKDSFVSSESQTSSS